METRKHLEYVEREKREGRQTSLIASSPSTLPKSKFSVDLCQAFVSANIPFNKLKNPAFRKFLFKYTDHFIPDESTLRKDYLNYIYKGKLAQLKSKIGDKSLWISVDETTDIKEQHVANLIIGIWGEDNVFLAETAFLDAANHETITQFVTNSIFQLYAPGSVPFRNIYFLFLMELHI